MSRSPLGVLLRRVTSWSSWAGMVPSECTEASRRTHRRPSCGRRGRRPRATPGGRRTSWSTAGTGWCSTRTGRWAHAAALAALLFVFARVSACLPGCVAGLLVSWFPSFLVFGLPGCVLTYFPRLGCGIYERNTKEVKEWRMHCFHRL